MPVNAFLSKLGFVGDPFESTNAENEPRLVEYFVPPPYFHAVMGDTHAPQSHIVFAPRGSGKTAQRRMIEEESASADFLCITYDKYDMPPGFTLDGVDLAYHLTQICRLLLLGVLAKLDSDPFLAEGLSSQQRHMLKFQADRFLGSLTIEQFEWAFRSIKSLGDKASDFWQRYGGPLAVAVNALLHRVGLSDVKIPAEFAAHAVRQDSLRYHFEGLLGIARDIGYASAYILVDKVDETPPTSSDSDAAFKLIGPLLLDLPTLESAGVGFKFFLWDLLDDAYRTGGGRPDRVQLLHLNWTVGELEQMLRERLRSFSNGRVGSISDLVCNDIQVDLQRLICYLAQGSPRDMIRMSKAIVDEETRLGASGECIKERSIWRGIRIFSEQKASELFDRFLPDLKRVGKPTFTISYVSSDVFHFTQQAGRAKIQQWTATGVVQQVGEVPTPGSRPQHLYGIVDLRVAIASLGAIDVPLILGNYAVLCPDCDALAVSAEQTIGCRVCGREFPLKGAKTLLELCSR